MSTKKPVNKTAVLVTFKEENKKVLYSSLKVFCNHHSNYSINTLHNYLSRKQTSYNDDVLTIERINYFNPKA